MHGGLKLSRGGRNKGQRQSRGAFPEMGKVPSEAEADEGAAFAFSLERGKKLVL